MEIFIDIVAVILGIVGLLGCILPVLPGPPCSLAGMFLLFLWGSPCAQDDITWRLLIIMLVVTVIVTVLDYVVPGWLTRATGVRNMPLAEPLPECSSVYFSSLPGA